MMIVTPKQFRGLFLATFLVGGVLLYSAVFFVLYMGWSWEEVARSVPSPELPPIPPVVWHAFQLAVAGLSVGIIVVGLAWLRQRWQPTLTPARQGSIRQQLLQAEQRAAQNQADNITLEAQLDVAQTALVSQVSLVEALRAARREDVKRFRAMLEKRANAAQLRPEPATLPALSPEERTAFWASINYGSEVMPERWARRIEQRLSAAGIELIRTGSSEPVPPPANLSVDEEKRERELRGEGGQFGPVRQFGSVRRERRNLPRARRGGVR